MATVGHAGADGRDGAAGVPGGDGPAADGSAGRGGGDGSLAGLDGGDAANEDGGCHARMHTSSAVTPGQTLPLQFQRVFIQLQDSSEPALMADAPQLRPLDVLAAPFIPPPSAPEDEE